MAEDRPRRFGQPSFARLSPDEEGTVFLKQKNVDRKLSVEIKDNSKITCINRFIQWVTLALYTLDIALFDVLHKDIVGAIIAAQKRGVRCRLLIYKYMMLGENRLKNTAYVMKMKKAGVQVHWMLPRSMPYPPSRLCLIDAIGATARKSFYATESGAIIGDQLNYRGGHNIMQDFEELIVRKNPPHNIIPWSEQFRAMWVATQAETEILVPPDIAGPSRVIGWLRRMV